MIQYRRDLYKLLPENAVIAELGVAEGNFSRDMLNWPNVKMLYMVDAWAKIDNIRGDGNFEQPWHDANYSKAMMKVNFAIDRVKVLRGITWDMAGFVEDGSLDFINIDACHYYECVKKDLNAWFPKVKQGGIVACHDYENTAFGVKHAVQDFCNGKYSINLIPEDKVEDAGCWFRKV